MPSLVLKAHAKINLSLVVGRKRKDGYHSLNTLFQEISLHDVLRFRVSSKSALRLKVSGRSVAAGKENLVVRALEMLKEKLGVSQGMTVQLTKKIPLGAGLGGGSSDAAAALWAGWLLWTNRPRSSYRRSLPPILFDCAKKLGADVPFFLKGGLARGAGFGEKLTFLPAQRSQSMILVYPRVHVATPLAYGLLDRSRLKQKSRKSSLFFNSFEPEVFKHFPKVKIVSETLKKAGCHPVLMSGSGSSVFGFVKNKMHANRVKRMISHQPWDVFTVTTV